MTRFRLTTFAVLASTAIFAAAGLAITSPAQAAQSGETKIAPVADNYANYAAAAVDFSTIYGFGITKDIDTKNIAFDGGHGFILEDLPGAALAFALDGGHGFKKDTKIDYGKAWQFGAATPTIGKDGTVKWPGGTCGIKLAISSSHQVGGDMAGRAAIT